LIYNFVIYTTVHFYSIFWRNLQSNRAKRNNTELCHATTATSRQSTPRAHALACVVCRPAAPRCPGPAEPCARGRAFPRSRLLEAARAPRHLGARAMACHALRHPRRALPAFAVGRRPERLYVDRTPSLFSWCRSNPARPFKTPGPLPCAGAPISASLCSPLPRQGRRLGELLAHSLPWLCHHSCTSPCVHKSFHRQQLPRADRRLAGAGSPLPPPQLCRRTPTSAMPLPQASSGGFCAPLSNRGLALHLRQELFHGGGWAMTTPSCLPHCVPVTVVALLNRVGRWHLLQARNLRRQHTNSRHQYSTTLFKMAYLSGSGLRDLQFLGHALAGHIARLPWRRGQTGL
jgi:hypothetical protein